MAANPRAMTSTDISSSELEALLRRLARQCVRVETHRTQALLGIMVAAEWGMRLMPLSAAALMGVVVTLFLAPEGETTARAHPAEISAPNRPAKANRLFDEFTTLFPDSIQVTKPPAPLDAATNSRFAFIRGGVDGTKLAWTSPQSSGKETLSRPPSRKFRRHKHIPAQQVRAAASQPQHHPWLLDLLIRHMARGS